MSLVLLLLMGTVVATALVVMAIMVVLRSNRRETKFEKRKTSHVTEILQVKIMGERYVSCRGNILYTHLRSILSITLYSKLANGK